MSGIMIQPTQGFFTQTNPATNQFIEIPAGFDSIEVFNQTVATAGNNGNAYSFFFDPNSMPNGGGFKTIKDGTIGASIVSALAPGTGFFVTDTSVSVPAASQALTAINAAATPVVTATTIVSLFNGDTVRLYNVTGGQQLGGLDFTIGAVTPTGGGAGTFTLAYMAQIAAATNGTFRKIPFDPIYYPRNRIITNITQATQAVVTLSVTHGFNPGQKVRLIIPTVSATAYGMIQLNDLVQTIVAVDTVNNTVTLDVDTTAMSPFVFPLTTDGDFTPAQLVPAGMDTAEALRLGVNIHSDASTDTAALGVILMAGALSPAGQAGDVIEWRAFQSFQ
jgi:hypothetical protein